MRVGFWETHLAADPDLAGKAIFVQRETYTVIGVAPVGFIGLAAPWNGHPVADGDNMPGTVGVERLKPAITH